MIGRTHMLIGALVGTVLELHAPGLGIIKGTTLGALAGLVPDLDHPNSTLSHKLAPIALGSRRISLAFMAIGVIYLAYGGWLPLNGVVAVALWLLTAAVSPHRGVTHSVIGLVSLTYAVHSWVGDMWVVFATAYASHLLADMVTDGGVPLAWPYPRDFSVRTGLQTGRFLTTVVEVGLQITCLGLLCVSLLPIVQPLLAISSVSELYQYIQKILNL